MDGEKEMSKGQTDKMKGSFIEGIMTYGWAILIILIIGVVLFYWGIVYPNRTEIEKEQLVNIIAPDFCQNQQYIDIRGIGPDCINYTLPENISYPYIINKTDDLKCIEWGRYLNFEIGRYVKTKDCKVGWGIECDVDVRCPGTEGWISSPIAEIFCGEEVLK